MTIRNIDRFKADMDALIELAGKLELALLVQVHGKEEVLEICSKHGVTKEELAKLPSFRVDYEAWYSECLALLKQLLPERLQQRSQQQNR